jgi:hypothetical protein
VQRDLILHPQLFRSSLFFHSQLHHWKKGGHKQVCKSLTAETSLAIILDKPTDGMFHSAMPLNGKTRGKTHSTGGYRKPKSVKVNEQFDIKVQGGGPTMPLMIYDKSREFLISLKPEDRGFKELLKAINNEPTWQGRKTFVTASFDAAGNCTVYPGKTSIKTW